MEHQLCDLEIQDQAADVYKRQALSLDLGNIGGVVLMIVMIACLLAFSMQKKKN